MIAPFFSVVIPTYNRADLLPASIQSVLEQRFIDFEIIVVDNCSTDNTADVMTAYEKDSRITYIANKKNMERAYSRNVGFKNARGRFVTLLDSDDIMYPHCLFDAHTFVNENPGKKFFHNLYEKIDQDGKPSKTINFLKISNQYKQICKGNFLSCIGVFMHEDIYRNFFFSEDLRMIGSEDYEIWFRVLAHYELGRIEGINCGIREHLGRSVYSSMYDNLEYQRWQIIGMIEGDPVLHEKYKNYIGYINTNYYYHQAIHSLQMNKRYMAVRFLGKSIIKGKGVFFSKRFFAFIKNLSLSFFRKSTKNN